MIELTDETGRLAGEELDRLRDVLAAWLEETGERPAEGLPLFSLILVDDRVIAELNIRDRGVSGATDVLSYPVHEPDDEGFPELPFKGDVFISLDTALQQAQAAGHSLLDEVMVLAAHGYTHLQGYDHRTEEEWKVFEAAQERVMKLARAAQRSGPGSDAA